MFNITDPNRLAMLNAGLGMMANSTGPNSGNAFGLGLQQGLQSYQNSLAQQKQEELLKKEQEMKQRQFEQQSLLRQMQIDDIVKKQQAEKSQKEALQNIFTPLSGLPGKGGQVERSAYAPPQDLQGMYSELIKSGNPELIMTGLAGLEKLKRNRINPTSFQQDWNMYNAASPEDQQRMLEFKRGQKWLNAGDRHINPATQQEVAIVPKVSETADFQSNVAREVDTAKAEVKQQAENKASAQQAMEAMNHVADIRRIAGSMSDRQLGPIANKLPNWSEEAQLLDSKLKNLLGNVRDKLGPGVLSDTDIKMLQDMLPHMGMDRGAFIQAVDMFENELRAKINRAGGNGGGEFKGFRVIR